MGEGALFGNLAHEHGNCAAHRLIDINDEHFIVISDKHRTPTTCRQDCPHLHLDHRFVHLVNGTRPRVKNKQGGSDPPAIGLRYVKWQVEGRIILVPDKEC
jgi:hypothetical protein